MKNYTVTYKSQPYKRNEIRVSKLIRTHRIIYMLYTTIVATRVLLAVEPSYRCLLKKMVYIFIHVPRETTARRDEDIKKDGSRHYHMRMDFFFQRRWYKITGSCILSAKYSWEFSDDINDRDTMISKVMIFERFFLLSQVIQKALDEIFIPTIYKHEK